MQIIAAKDKPHDEAVRSAFDGLLHIHTTNAADATAN